MVLDLPEVLGFDGFAPLSDSSVEDFIKSAIPPLHVKRVTRVKYDPQIRLTTRYVKPDTIWAKGLVVIGEARENKELHEVEIVIRPRSEQDSQEDIKRVIAHEFGHNVFASVLTSESQKFWKQIVQVEWTAEELVRFAYAEDPKEEAFCDSYADYVNKIDIFNPHHPNSFQFLQEYVFNARTLF